MPDLSQELRAIYERLRDERIEALRKGRAKDGDPGPCPQRPANRKERDRRGN